MLSLIFRDQEDVLLEGVHPRFVVREIVVAVLVSNQRLDELL